MMTMQQDAMRRVQEMQRIAKSRVNGGQESAAVPPAAPPPADAPKKEQHKPPEKKEASSAPSAGGNVLQDLLSGLNLDSDRLIILMLLIVLMNEGVDGKLLLALCYLLL